MSSNVAAAVKSANEVAQSAQKLSEQTMGLADKLNHLAVDQVAQSVQNGVDPLIFAVTIFVLACFIGYYVVWKVTPALHTPLMSVTNAVSGIIIVGAIIALGPKGFGAVQITGFIAVMLAAVNIFGGFVVTQRMLSMFRKK
jgi:NAD(P) transhydrogenase subunit alpha